PTLPPRLTRRQRRQEKRNVPQRVHDEEQQKGGGGGGHLVKQVLYSGYMATSPNNSVVILHCGSVSCSFLTPVLDTFVQRRFNTLSLDIPFSSISPSSVISFPTNQSR